jgi:hypothetical protein
MKKYLILMLTLTLTFAWVWAGEEDVKDLGYTASSEQQEAKWQPEYGPKGDLLNPEPGVTLARTSTPGGELDPPVIATTLLSEDFEDADWGDPDNPPPGWTILDNGNEGQQMWYNQDWHKYYYSASGFADTVARVAYTPWRHQRELRYRIRQNFYRWRFQLVNNSSIRCQSRNQFFAVLGEL